MECGKVLVLIQKSALESIPVDVFEHEVRILLGVSGGNVQVLGKMLDDKGNQIRLECGSAVEELDRLRGAYDWMDGGRGVNAAEMAFGNDPHRLHQAMKEGLSETDRELIERSGVSETVQGIEPLVAPTAAPPVKDRYLTVADLRRTLDELGVDWEKKEKRYGLLQKVRHAIEIRAEDVGVDTDAVRSDEELLGLLPAIAAAEAARAEAGAGA